jgi:murein peptide amidase A
VLVLALFVGVVVAALAGFPGGSPRQAPPKARSGPATLARSIRRSFAARSVRGRAIRAFDLGNPHLRRTLLVVGCVHGNECAGKAIVRALEAAPAPVGADVWLIPDLNPDGHAARRRQNAHGVDLNRNFPYHWRALGARGDLEYSGPRALSEPESRFAAGLILHLRPAITIWFHQPLAKVDESGGSLALERRFARLIGLPLERLPRYPGSAAGWQNHRLAGTTAFVVELPRRRLDPRTAHRYAEAILDLAGDRPGI